MQIFNKNVDLKRVKYTEKNSSKHSLLSAKIIKYFGSRGCLYKERLIEGGRALILSLLKWTHGWTYQSKPTKYI